VSILLPEKKNTL